MMRILCGLDSRYQGDISLLREAVGGGEEGRGGGGGGGGGEGGGGGDDGEEEEREDEDEDSLTFLATLFTVRWWGNLFRGCYRGVIYTRRNHHHDLSPSATASTSSPSASSSSPLPTIGATDSSKRRRKRAVGWCPQEDAIFEFLTVREHLELFEALLGQGLGQEPEQGQGQGPGLGQGLGQGHNSTTPSSSMSAVDLTLARLGRDRIGDREGGPPWLAVNIPPPFKLSY